jgi:hypothetical protein
VSKDLLAQDPSLCSGQRIALDCHGALRLAMTAWDFYELINIERPALNRHFLLLEGRLGEGEADRTSNIEQSGMKGE